MTQYILFMVVILVTNVIHGITGFAGTLMAMPFGLMLVGYPVAKPVLNVLGLLSGVYVFIGNYKKVKWSELIPIVIIMALGIGVSIPIRGMFADNQKVLYIILGVFVIVLALQGLWKLYREGKAEKTGEKEKFNPALYGILPIAGIVHGLFVSGGPLLISYLAKKIDDKVIFRSTISTIWIFLNTLILFDDIVSGLWTSSLIKVQLVSGPFMLAGMYLGGQLMKRMSQRVFMIITYVLLLISGASLIL